MTEPPPEPSEPPEPQPVTIEAPMRRSFSPGMFADLTEVPVTGWQLGRPLWSVTFADALDDETCAAVCARMESTDDSDQAARAALRAAAAGGALNLAAMTCAYVLGDPMPEPVLPADDTEAPVA